MSSSGSQVFIGKQLPLHPDELEKLFFVSDEFGKLRLLELNWQEISWLYEIGSNAEAKNISLKAAYDSTCKGQAAIRAAFLSQDNYGFKFVFGDGQQRYVTVTISKLEEYFESNGLGNATHFLHIRLDMTSTVVRVDPNQIAGV